MRSAELERLILDLQHDGALRAELQRLGGDFDHAVRRATEKGYQLTRQDAEELIRSFQELSDEDLDKAAGGAWNDPTPPSSPTGGGTGG